MQNQFEAVRRRAGTPPQRASWIAGLAAFVLASLVLVTTPLIIGGAPRLLADRGAELFIALTSLWAGAEAAASSRWSASATENPTTAGALARRLGTVSALLLLLLAIVPLAVRAVGIPPADPGESAFVLGGIAMSAGAAIRVLAIRRLGARFTSDNAIANGALLESGGLYGRLAHPSELGLLLIAAGGLALLTGPTLWMLLAPFYLLTLARVRLEEHALLARHGDAYRGYRARTLDPMPAFVSSSMGKEPQ